MISLRETLRLLETNTLVNSERPRATGKRDFRDAFLRKIRHGSEAGWTENSNGDWVPVPDSSKVSTKSEVHSSEGMERWAAEFDEASWRKFLDEQGLDGLDGWSLVKNTEFGPARDDSERRSSCLSFAFFMLSAVELGVLKEQMFVDQQAEEFHFTYGKSWEEASRECRAERGRP